MRIVALDPALAALGRDDTMASPARPLNPLRPPLNSPRNLYGVPGLRRAERQLANPSNLIRVMPAEGAEMRARASAHRSRYPDAPARARAARALHHQCGRADLHGEHAARGRRGSVDDACGRRDRRVRGARRRAAGQSRHVRRGAARRRPPPRSRSRPKRRIPWVLDPVFIDRSRAARGLCEVAGRAEAARDAAQRRGVRGARRAASRRTRRSRAMRATRAP